MTKRLVKDTDEAFVCYYLLILDFCQCLHQIIANKYHFVSLTEIAMCG